MERITLNFYHSVYNVDKNCYKKENSLSWFLKVVFMMIMILQAVTILKAQSVSGGWDAASTTAATGYHDYGSGVIQLLDVNNSNGCQGAAVHETSVKYDPSSGTAFSKCYKVYFGCPGNDNIGSDTKGDGMAFSFSKCAYNINNGACGGGLGYHGACPQMITIEFDTYDNQGNTNFDGSYGGGTTGNHDEIALHKNGEASDAGRITSADVGNLEDGLEHTVCISYDPATNILSVTIDGNTVLSYDATGTGNELEVYFGAGGLNQTWSSGKHGATNPATVSDGANIASTIGAPLCPAVVEITSPSDGASIGGCSVGPLTITANATAPAGNAVSYVEFFIDGVSIGTDNTATNISNFEINWNTPTNGNHVITAVAHYAPSGTSSGSAAVSVTVGGGIDFTPTAPTIDGTAEAVWNSYASASLTKGFVSPPDLAANYKTTYDANNLYILVDVTDSDLWNDGGNIYDNDGVEVFIDIGNDKTVSYGANDYQFAFAYNNTTVTEYKHNATTGVTFSQGAKAGGYIMEIKLPWSTLGGTPTIGSYIGFDVKINDDDGGGIRDHELAWKDGSFTAWNNASLMGSLEFLNCQACPTSNAGTTQNLCNVTSTTLAANTLTSPATGTWSLVSGPNTPSFVTQSSPSSNVTGMIAGTYVFKWTVTSGSCTPATSNITVNVSAQPTSNAGTIQNLCNVTTTTLAANAPIAPASGAWSLVSGPNTPSVTTLSNASSGVTGMIAGTYVFKWTVSNGSCTPATSNVTLNISAQPTSDAGTTQNLCNVTSTTLAAGTPSSPATGEWTLVSGPNTPSITTLDNPSSGVTGMIAGSYIFKWTVSNGSCTPATSNVTLNISAQPTSDAGTTQNLCNVTSTTLAASTPSSPATGTWSLVSGPNTPSITTLDSPSSGLTGMVAGSYVFKWTVSNGTCASASSNMAVNISELPASNAGTTQNLCNVTLSTLAANTPTIPATGAWSLVNGPNTPSITTLNSPSSDVTGMIAGTYVFRWTVSNGSCTPATSDVTVNISTPPTSNAGTIQDLCNATSTTLAANTPTIPATGAWTLVSGPNIPNFTSLSNPNSGVTGMITGTYVFRWTVSNGTCTNATSDLTVNNNSIEIANAGSTQNLCNVSSTQLAATAPSSSSTGIWKLVSGPNIPTITSQGSENSIVTDLVPGNYIFKWLVSNGSCPVSSSDVTINNSVAPLKTSAGLDQPLLCDDNASLSAEAPVDGTGSWNIISGEFNITDPASPITTLTNIPVGTVTLEWVIINGACDPARDTVVITRNPQVTIASVEDDRNICQSSVQLDANVATVGTGTWSSSNPTVSFVDANDPNTIVSGLSVGHNPLTWTVSGMCGQTSDQVDIVVGISTITIDVNANQDTLCFGTPVDLSASVFGSNATPFIYTWISSDSSFINKISDSIITVKPQVSGWTNYIVSVMDANGCTANSPGRDSVYVVGQQTLVVPNLLTPNGDGKNECMIIRDIDEFDIIPGAQFDLFNRWGEAVYKNNFYKNGDFCGSSLTDGIYYYYIKTSCDNREITGWLQIISSEASNK